MTTTLGALGTVAGYAVKLVRRDAAPQDAVGGRTALAVTLTAGSNTYEAAVIEDGGDASRQGRLIGLGIIKAFAAIGGSVTLGTPGQAPVTGSDPNAQGAYTRAVPLTPGTPVPPGRGAFVAAVGAVKLILSGGGSVTVYDNSAGGGARFDHLAVVDADVSGATKASISILY